MRSILISAAALLLAAPLRAAPPADWPARLQATLHTLAATEPPASLGVYVRDLDDGRSVSLHADERWYLASMVKLPVAIAVLQAVERGALTLQTRLVLRADDLVDGAGSTSRRPVGTPVALRTLLEQMMIESDNTASDMLIGLVGLRAVQAVLDGVAPDAFGRLTTLADVRRGVYGGLTPAAERLAGHDFLRLKAQPGDAQRLALLPVLLHVPAASLAPIDLDTAYARYYASGVNSGRLDAYGELLARLAEGRLLDAPRTAWLLDVMARARTGAQRIRAGLPAGTRFAHKTGTQRARTCDAGLATARTPDGPRRVVVAACTRGEASRAQAERLLKGVGRALCAAGLLGAAPRSDTTEDPHDEPACRPPDPAPDDARAGAGHSGRAGAAAGTGHR